MYPTGWKLSDDFTATTTAISEFATGLEGDVVIPCESSSMCLIGLGTNGTATSSILQVWGTQTNGEASQSIDFCMNSKLATVTDGGADSVGSMVVPNSAITAFSTLIVVFAPSGGEDDTGTPNAIPSVHWFNRLQGGQTVPAYLDSENTSSNPLSGDLALPLKLWYFNGSVTDSGPAWIAVPCGPFNYLQCEFSGHNSGTVGVWSNLLR